MNEPLVSHAFLASQIRWARGRGIPVQDAEDLVFDAYQRAATSFKTERGDFASYMHTIVRNATAYWWRQRSIQERVHGHLRLIMPPDSARAERAARNQARVVEALSETEQQIFAAWALQKHLGKGQVTSEDMSASLGMNVKDYENAKRRLKSRLQRVLDELGWTVEDVLYGEDDVAQVG